MTDRLARNRGIGACFWKREGEGGEETEDDNGGTHIGTNRIGKAR
jgi:hypothetical protein